MSSGAVEVEKRNAKHGAAVVRVQTTVAPSSGLSCHSKCHLNTLERGIVLTGNFTTINFVTFASRRLLFWSWASD